MGGLCADSLCYYHPCSDYLFPSLQYSSCHQINLIKTFWALIFLWFYLLIPPFLHLQPGEGHERKALIERNEKELRFAVKEQSVFTAALNYSPTAIHFLVLCARPRRRPCVKVQCSTTWTMFPLYLGWWISEPSFQEIPKSYLEKGRGRLGHHKGISLFLKQKLYQVGNLT